jgi:DNA-binding beta-propeller fold protein YncE
MTDDCCDGTGGESSSQRPLVDPDRTDPFESGIGRRRLLRTSGAVGATAALAGCLGDSGGGGTPTVLVFNTGDRTVSVIDAETDELLESIFVDTTASFPANQYTTGADSDYDIAWLNVDGGVRALDQTTLEEQAFVETGYGPNYPNVTPDGEHLVIASGGTTNLEPNPENPPNHEISRVDADPGSDSFGEVTDRIETDYVGPCDMTIGPDGEYAFVVDVNGETLRVVRIDPFENAALVDVGESVTDGDVLPFMCTASFDGEFLLVENGEGEIGPDPDIERVGSESVWDISDPENPEELARITRDDGLPSAPITSEVAPDSEAAYLFTPGAGVTVIDMESFEVADTLDIGGTAISGAWGPNREKLYAPVQDANEVAVIEHESREVVATVEAGEAPTGALAGTTRPDADTTARLQASLASLGLEFGQNEATFCVDDHCYCG